jgi:3-methyladenine DNA glycosylase AlkD
MSKMIGIREQIFELADQEYRKFQSALCPGCSNILGVRVPLLRNLAKDIARDDWREYLENAGNDYFEEIMLQGMVIGYAQAETEELIGYIKAFVPKIDNWAVCDSFCTGLKFTKKNRERIWDNLHLHLSSKEEFEIRFGTVMLLNYYIDEDYIDRVLLMLDGIKHEGYYVKMAIAWALSLCFVKFPEKTMNYLLQNTLDNFTFNKSLQKITESLRVDKETKILIRGMRRK